MVVTIKTYPEIRNDDLDVENSDLDVYELLIDCDKFHKRLGRNRVNIMMYKHGRLVHELDTKQKVKVFIMDEGKTVDRIDFTPLAQQAEAIVKATERPSGGI